MNTALNAAFPHASRLAFGAMGLGGGWNRNGIGADDIAHAQAAIDAALEIGITVFDHADIYTFGKAEQVFGEVLRQRPALREAMLLQSKCGIRFADEAGPKRYDLSAEHILASVDASLKRLHTDHLDILMLHRPDPLMEPIEVARAWRQLKAAGKVRRLGVSNMHAAQLEWLSSALDEAPVANQLEMSLLKRDWLEAGVCFNDAQGQSSLAWSGTLEYCQRHAIQLQAWGALGKGWFSGAAPADAAPAVQRTAALVATLARRHGVPPESLVLAWLLKHPARIQPVIGTSQPQRIRACAAATTVELSRAEWYQLYDSARGHELP